MSKLKKNPNPQVFLEISIDGRAAEKITFELFANIVPKTAENFRALCTGERGVGESTKKPLYFRGTNIHRIVKGFMAQGGDFSRGDGRGGESIYGAKFPDENFKLKHDQPGLLSMANSGPDSNGSQFFITFNPVPHLDGKHVVFGKVVNGIALLKKLEAVGSDGGTGKPTCQVKIVNCGEASDISTENQLQGEKEKKLKRAVEVNPDAEGKVKTKKPLTDDKRRKKRKHYYSSDSYSSDTSDSRSYSSDSGSDSESYSSASSDTSSSSDHRHKRRKGSKKDKRKSVKKKSSHKKSKSKSRGTKKKSKRSYESSTDDSKSPMRSSSSSDSESGGRHTKRSLKKDQESTKMVNLEKVKTLDGAEKGKDTVTTGNILHEGIKDENGAAVRSRNQNLEDKPNKSSDYSNSIKADAILTKPDGDIVADAAEIGISRAATEKNPVSNEPVPNNGKDLAMPSTGDGRIRKGRGFTDKYSFARKYRTPSPERSPIRPHYNGGRNDRWNNSNRYGRNGPYNARSPVRRYPGSQRASSPPRYPRRDRSRSRSRSPVRRRDHGYRRPSPRRSRSPTEQRREVTNRLRSGRGGGAPNLRGSSPPANRGRSRSRSKSRDPSRSRSPDVAPAKKGSSKYNRDPSKSRSPDVARAKKGSSKYNRRRSSSSRSSSPAGSKGGLVSY